MPTENIEEVQGTETEQDYIETIAQLKQNTVARSDYNKLKEENKKLLDSIVNGTEIEKPVQESVSDLRKEIFSGKLNNYDYWDKTLKLRDALIAEGKDDPFLPQGVKVTANQIDYDGAEKVATIVKECLDYADHDSTLFTNELQRRMKESMPIKRR